MAKEIEKGTKSICCGEPVEILGRFGGKEKRRYCTGCNIWQDGEMAKKMAKAKN